MDSIAEKGPQGQFENKPIGDKFLTEHCTSPMTLDAKQYVLDNILNIPAKAKTTNIEMPFDHWLCFYDNIDKYRVKKPSDIESFKNIAFENMLKTAQTFNEWDEIHSTSINERDVLELILNKQISNEEALTNRPDSYDAKRALVEIAFSGGVSPEQKENYQKELNEWGARAEYSLNKMVNTARNNGQWITIYRTTDPSLLGSKYPKQYELDIKETALINSVDTANTYPELKNTLKIVEPKSKEEEYFSASLTHEKIITIFKESKHDFPNFEDKKEIALKDRLLKIAGDKIA